MSDDRVKYLHEQATTAQSKYSYFLLAGAAAAIALALKQTESAQLHWRQLPLALALICWALSFFFGCRFLAWVQATLHANITLLLVEQGEYPNLPAHPDLRRAAAEGVRSAAEANAEGANRNARRQFRWLVGGSISFIAWHLLEMIARTPSLIDHVPSWLR